MHPPLLIISWLDIVNSMSRGSVIRGGAASAISHPLAFSLKSRFYRTLLQITKIYPQTDKF